METYSWISIVPSLLQWFFLVVSETCTDLICELSSTVYLSTNQQCTLNSVMTVQKQKWWNFLQLSHFWLPRQFYISTWRDIIGYCTIIFLLFGINFNLLSQQWKKIWRCEYRTNECLLNSQALIVKACMLLFRWNVWQLF